MENISAALDSLRTYLSSIEIRSDTKASLLVGLAIGLVVVMLIVLYPGEPIDYSGMGVDVLPEMQGVKSDHRKSQGKAKVNGPIGEDAGGEGEPRLEVVMVEESEGSQGLRRRRGAGRGRGQGEKSTLKGEGATVAARQGDMSGDSTDQFKGSEENWDAQSIDEEKMAKRLASGKAGKLLGITEDQVRKAVREAKSEMLTGEGGSMGYAGGEGMSLSGMIHGVMMLASLGLLYVYLATNNSSVASRFLQGLFPKEMTVLGLMPSGETAGPGGSPTSL